MRVLVDTSVWSLALRRRKDSHNPEAEELRRLITAHVAELIGPIRQEILSGVRDAAQFACLEEHLATFPDLPLLTEDYVTAAKFFNVCRSKGIQGSNTDFLICAVAVRHDLAIFTTDGDFPQFARCLPIMLHEARRQSKQEGTTKHAKVAKARKRVNHGLD
jgi:predicted nucleic acid-binding protein